MCAGSCALFSPTIGAELANRGPIRLSSSNPYLASNIFIARQMDSSGVFKGFIKTRGVPDALQVVHGLLSSSVVYLYYLDAQEEYALQVVENDWVIHGPERMDTIILDQLGIKHQIGETVLAGKENNRRGVITARKQVAEEELETDPLADMYSEDSIEATSDIVHVVQSGENLSLIAAWYTGDSSNSKRIARINGLQTPDRLKTGMKLRIPRYLVKNEKPLK